MKRLVALLIVLGLGLGTTGVATAATGTEKQDAIDDALAWLASEQQGDGRWDYGDDNFDTAATGAALLAFIEERQRTPGGVDYSAEINFGMTYLLSRAQIVSISPQPAGNPDSDGNQVGVKFVPSGNNSRDTYVTGLVIPAIAKYIVVFSKANDLVPSGPLTLATGGTGAGGAWTYRDILVNTLDYFAFGQNDSGTGRGGWRYWANYSNSDNSTAQWPVIAMLFASESGVNPAAFVKDELAWWTEYIQNANGGSGYDSPTYLVNESKTGGLLVEMIYAEDDTGGTPYDLTNTDLLAALTYLNNNWLNGPSATWDGNIGHPYAMWSIYKGLEVSVGKGDTTYMTNLRTQSSTRPGGAPLDPGVDWNWWEDYCEYLVVTQSGDGFWSGYSSWTGPLATAWYVNILQGIRIPEAPDCAILGEEAVYLRNGSDVVASPSNVCSNGMLHTGARVSVDTSLLALGDMQLGDGTEVGNDAFMNGNLNTGARVSIGFADGPDDLDVDAGGDVTLYGGTVVEGECQYGDAIFQGPGAECGTVTYDTNLPFANPFALPECAVTPPVPESPNIQTRPRSTEYFDAPLQPGDYGNVSFGPGNKVAIEAGEYHFQSLYFGPNTEIEIRGPITVHVVDSLLFTNGVKETLVGVEPSKILYLLNGEASANPLHRGGARTVLYGTFCGPHSRIVIGDGSELTGAIIGRQAELGAQVKFTADPAPVQ